MVFDRVEAKLRAKESIRSTRPGPVLVTLVYLLLTSGVAALLDLFISNPFDEAIEYYYQWGYSWQEVVEYVMSTSRGVLVIYGIVNLLLLLYRAVMSYGYTSYSLRLSRNEQPGYANLFDGFSRFLLVLGTSLLMGLVQFLWSLLYTLPAILIMVLTLVLVGQSSFPLVMFLYWLLMVYVGAVTVAVSLRYRLTFYFLLDEPQCGPMEAIRKSREAMRGRKTELLVLDLSFIGWILVVIITMGLASVWVSPYVGATEAIYYDTIVPRQHDPREGYTGDIYSATGREDQGPF